MGNARQLSVLSFAASALIALTLTATSANAQTIRINGETVVTNTELGKIDQGSVYIKDGQITAIAANSTLEADQVISGEYWITPGFFAGYSNLGLVEVSAEDSTNDIQANDAKQTASLRAVDAFNPNATTVSVSRLGGVLYAATVPGTGADILAGIGAIVDTSGDQSSVIKDEAFMYVQLGSGGANKAGGSRTASVGYLRNALVDANKSGGFATPDAGDILPRLDARALRKASNGTLPLFIQADRASDLRTIASLKTDFPKLRLTIVGAAEGWLVADDLADNNISVLLDPIEKLPYSFDMLAANENNAKILMEANVKTGIVTRSASSGFTHNLRLIAQSAGNAVTTGLSWDDAFAATTLTPASLFGMSSKAQIKAGDTANLVVWNGDPLEATSLPVAIIIDGKLQSLESRQTKLRDRYHPDKNLDDDYGYRP